jgi:hypothetical protein
MKNGAVMARQPVTSIAKRRLNNFCTSRDSKKYILFIGM